MAIKTRPSDPSMQSLHPFNLHFFKGVGVACVLLGGALLIGILGYRFIAGFAWIDALLDAAMILAGMGEINPLTSNAAKVFAAMYALLSGLVFLTAAGAILAPIFHHVLHRFHIEGQR
jgi:hypothetical protein